MENNYMEWVRTRIEYDQEQKRYYAVGHHEEILEGIAARIRG